MEYVSLPSEYRQVEWLESTGTQYIWTDVAIQDGLTVESLQTFASGNDSYLFGGKGTASGSEYNKTCFNGGYSGLIQGAYPNSYYDVRGSKNYSFDNQTLYHIKTTHADAVRQVYVDDVLINDVTVSGTVIQSDKKCLCFGFNNNGTPSYLYKGKVHYIKVSKYDDLLAHFIPCYRISDDKPGMYDLVSNTFYTNSGTGEFRMPPRLSMMAIRRRILANTPHVESVSGSSVQFSTDMETLLKEGRIYFSPKQDLHGYDKPWIGGTVNNMIPDGTDTSNGYIAGSYLNADGTTTELASSAWYVSEYFSVVSGNTYTWSSVNSSTVAPSICFYDENKEYISGEQANGELPKTLVAPTGAVYCRASQNSNSERLCQFEAGSTATTILPYSNVCPIEGWDGIDLTVCKKNLFDKTNGELLSALVNANTLTLSSDNTLKSFCVPCKPNTQYTVSGMTALSTWGSFVSKSIGTVATVYKKGNGTITTGQNDSYLIGLAYTNNLSYDYRPTLQIEEGSTATTYEPYSGQSFTIPFEHTIYGGYVDLVNGEVVETWTSKTFNGSGLIDYAGNGYNGTLCTNRYLTFTPNSSQTYQQNTAISDCLESKKVSIWSDANNNPNSFTVNGRYQLHFCFSNDLVGIESGDTSTVKTNKIKAYMAEHPVQVVYPLYTSTHIPLTDPPTIKTLKGINNLISSANGDIQISYFTH